MTERATARASRPAIRVESLRFTWPGASGETLRGLDFEIRENEVFGVLGPSGAGKSTTQGVLTGVLRGWSGEILVGGRRLSDLGADWREEIGVSFEFPNVYSRLTARENLSFFASLYRGATAPADELLDLVGLLEVADDRVSTFSKGMKLRLNLCRAFLPRPRLVFLDEPTSGQDPANARRIKDLIHRTRERGTTVVLMTHDMSAAGELCDRVAFMVEGAIPVIGDPRDLMLRHGRPALRVEHSTDGQRHTQEFALARIGEDADFLRLLRSDAIETMHTLEATLEDVFVAVTGSRLGGDHAAGSPTLAEPDADAERPATR